jgi:predicted RNase H-like nuclease
MLAVLGIDAAWTERAPSGVGLVARRDGRWTCLGLAPSYEAFCRLAEGIAVDWSARVAGSAPQPEWLLAASEKLLGGSSVTVVAVDMPVATAPVTGRRAADDAISAAFGRLGCGVHSPTAERPGAVGAALTADFERLGYRLATAATAPGTPGRLLEVYPHPALLRLLSAPYRVPYKVSRARRYWPAGSPSLGRRRLLQSFGLVLEGLRGEIGEIPLHLPSVDEAATQSALKRYEDALDALICAWAGIRYLERRARAYGDETAAVWVPEG